MTSVPGQTLKLTSSGLQLAGGQQLQLANGQQLQLATGQLQLATTNNQGQLQLAPATNQTNQIQLAAATNTQGQIQLSTASPGGYTVVSGSGGFMASQGKVIVASPGPGGQPRLIVPAHHLMLTNGDKLAAGPRVVSIGEANQRVVSLGDNGGRVVSLAPQSGVSTIITSRPKQGQVVTSQTPVLLQPASR